MKKSTIRLTEEQLHKVIKESVKKIIKELKASTYLDAAEKARQEHGDWRNIPLGKRQIRGQQYNALKDYGAQKDREERGVSEDDYDNFKKLNTAKLSRRALKGCDAHEIEMKKRGFDK